MRKILTLFVVALVAIVVFVSTGVNAIASDAIPGAPQKKTVALVGATIHTVSGATLSDATLVFDKGRITAIGDVKAPDGAEVINLKGRHIYPGLIESYSQLGLIEISAVRSTNDSSESGSFNPNVKAHIAVNPDSEILPVTRSNGVLLAMSAPSGGIMSGQASLLQLDGWTSEDLTLKAGVGIMVERLRFAELREFFADARAYQVAIKDKSSGQLHDQRLAALQKVLAGEMPIIVQADRLHDIQAAVAFANSENVKLIILGGYDAELAADLLKEHRVPVIIKAIFRSPRRRDDVYDAAYTLPERLRSAGVTYCLSGMSQFREGSLTRNLPYHAGMAAAFGLPKDEALKAITLYPAQILGVADRVGSLDEGKDATLFITSGDILETETQVFDAWIQGRKLDLTDRHKQLYQKYKTKYDRQKSASE